MVRVPGDGDSRPGKGPKGPEVSVSGSRCQRAGSGPVQGTGAAHPRNRPGTVGTLRPWPAANIEPPFNERRTEVEDVGNLPSAIERRSTRASVHDPSSWHARGRIPDKRTAFPAFASMNPGGSCLERSVLLLDEHSGRYADIPESRCAINASRGFVVRRRTPITASSLIVIHIVGTRA